MMMPDVQSFAEQACNGRYHDHFWSKVLSAQPWGPAGLQLVTIRHRYDGPGDCSDLFTVMLLPVQPTDPAPYRLKIWQDLEFSLVREVQSNYGTAKDV